jgi:hypothetical protein
MPLTLPSATDLQNYKEEVSDADALLWASDLFRLATGITTDPTDEFELRLVKLAILEMAWAIQTKHEDLEESFSPFTSERIGSYSYSKAQQDVAEGRATGISAFDRAVLYFMAQALGGVPLTDTEWVFGQGYTEDEAGLILHDPAERGTAAWPNIDLDQEGVGEVLVLPSGAPVPLNTPDDTLIVYLPAT